MTDLLHGKLFDLIVLPFEELLDISKDTDGSFQISGRTLAHLNEKAV